MKKILKVIGIGGSLALLLALGVTVALAQSGESTADGEATLPRMPFAGRDGGLLDTLAELLGLDRDDVVTELESGLTPAELAEQNGVARETLIEELVGQARERITEQVESPWQARVPSRQGVHNNSGFMPLGDLAEALDMSSADLTGALQDGSTITELAESAGVDLDALVDGWMADQEARLAEAVEAGRLDQEQADEMLANMAEQIDALLNGELSFGMPGMGGHSHGGMRGGFAPRSNDDSAAPSIDGTSS